MIRILLLVLFMVSTAKADSNSFKVVHYNIKELTTRKLLNPNSEQLQSVKRVLDSVPLAGADFLSINEIQYDTLDVPEFLPEFQTIGENMQLLGQILRWDPDSTEDIFTYGNTGHNAERGPGNKFFEDRNAQGALEKADKVNFGLFPGAYATGALYNNTKFNFVRKVTVPLQLMWEGFPPSGHAPMPLIDKSFTDTVLEFNGKEIHFILFHTVPTAFQELNNLRNAEQLKFLKWYLTGNGEEKTFALHGSNETATVKSLPAGTPFVAMGDWNVDHSDVPGQKPGAAVLRDLFDVEGFKIWHRGHNPTYLTQRYQPPARWLSQLDYILVGPGLEVVQNQSGVYHPDSNFQTGPCGSIEAPPLPPPNEELVQVQYWNFDEEQRCQALVSPAFRDLKQASDHIPIWADIKLVD